MSYIRINPSDGCACAGRDPQLYTRNKRHRSRPCRSCASVLIVARIVHHTEWTWLKWDLSASRFVPTILTSCDIQQRLFWSVGIVNKIQLHMSHNELPNHLLLNYFIDHLIRPLKLKPLDPPPDLVEFLKLICVIVRNHNLPWYFLTFW